MTPVHVDLSQSPVTPEGHDAAWTPSGALACPCGHRFSDTWTPGAIYAWLEHLPRQPVGTLIAIPRPPRPTHRFARVLDRIRHLRPYARR